MLYKNLLYSRSLAEQEEKEEHENNGSITYVYSRIQKNTKTKKNRITTETHGKYLRILIGGQRGNGAELASAASERSDRRWGEDSDRRWGETSRQTDMGLTVTGRRTNRHVEGSSHSCRGILFLTHSNTSARGRIQEKSGKHANGGRTEKQRDAE